MSMIDNTCRELTIDEVNTVSGGANVCLTSPMACIEVPFQGDGFGGGGGGGGGKTPAGAWNDCLGVFGYPAQA